MSDRTEDDNPTADAPGMAMYETTLEERWRKEVEVDSGRNSPSVNLKDLVRMMKRVAAACAKFRDGGYYHNDLKPSNTGEVDGRIVFIDYGCTLKIEEASHQEVSAGTDFRHGLHIRRACGGGRWSRSSGFRTESTPAIR